MLSLVSFLVLVMCMSSSSEAKKNELTHAKFNKYFGKTNGFCAHHQNRDSNDPMGLRLEEEDLKVSKRITGRVHPLVKTERECNGIPDSEWIEIIEEKHFRRVRRFFFSYFPGSKNGI